MARKSNTPFPIHDDIDRAQLQVYRGACKLTVIAATDPSPSRAERAMDALVELGTMASPPVAAVIDKIPSVERRRMLVDLLRELPPRLEVESMWALLRLWEEDHSEEVRAAAGEAAEVLRLWSHEWFRRRKELRADWDRIRGWAPSPKTGDEEVK